MNSSLDPFLTSTIPGIGGRIRTVPEDFNVEERPLYLPCGEGEHLYVTITKRGLSTPDLVRRLSSSLGIKAQAIGVAGLKDARAVTTQMVSLQGVAPEQLAGLKIDDMVLSLQVLGRHRNRLRTGHHAGNRFRLVIRNVADHAAESVPAILEQLSTRGVPNYFGPQRQGKRGDNHEVGAALLHDARRREKMNRAQRIWYLNAYQSFLFNRMLARRIDHIDRIFVGDWTMKSENGACFQVEDADQEQPRADRFEISPTGILFGSRVSWANGEPGRIEEAVIAEAGTTRETLIAAAKACGFRGERRAFRVPLTELEWSLSDDALTLSFSLPPGAYATSVLRELMKSPPTNP
ncbi:MAG: tRNA pseudouridine(13) synthase TruD [Nitrospira sp.]|nr:tRNA pseudouridine(13) synthase TruD [Nitrospira sp.]MDH4369296.1 tRNA pseudouridine(13) synthase TruD [Nitrospira sp.]MDH5347241.1 tRNA pseudouridine(13) synthase TruD [Nitrospira sp.]MDH5497692.1 tRNA pseudouridine(13) synthase TruD [Nitrospira sp.]MDH5727076.1 tRNA pseudouridine(13) synthase TruD [Nitrospira sp.]